VPRVIIYYKDGSAFPLDEESEGKAFQAAQGISTHEDVDRTTVCIPQKAYEDPVFVRFVNGTAITA
jgi:hypothetical protein